ncbi:hypothetical protein V6Z11_1Z090900 [Gossypium hirsutum]
MAARETFNVTAASPSTIPHSPWHSPVPYLFGGLAAMLGLIAFALLILACSYWKLSGYLENGERGEGDRDLEAGDETQRRSSCYGKSFCDNGRRSKANVLGHPISSSRSSSFGDKSCCCGEKGEKLEEETTSGDAEDQHQQPPTQETQHH